MRCYRWIGKNDHRYRMGGNGCRVGSVDVGRVAVAVLGADGVVDRRER
jgi:hypothetical protein